MTGELTKSTVNPTPQLKKEKWVDPTYGEMPFKTVRKLTAKVTNLKSPPYAAHVQYNLSVLDPILRVLVDFRGALEVIYEPKSITKEGIKEYVEKKMNTYDLTTKHEVTIISDEEMDYIEVPKSSYNLTARELTDIEKSGKSFNHMGTGGKESLV